MKNISLIFCFVCVTLVSTSQKLATEKTYYYFCLSESATHYNNDGKEIILYTEIKTVTVNEGFFAQKAAEWAKKVNDSCENKNGCSSDVNYYPTYDAADVVQKKIYQRYWNPSKYVMKQVKF